MDQKNLKPQRSQDITMPNRFILYNYGVTSVNQTNDNTQEGDDD